MLNWWSRKTEFIRPFGMDHLIYILLFAAAAASLILDRERIRTKRKQYGYGILALSVLQQVIMYSWYFIETGFDLSESLPLQIYRISALLGVWYLLTKNRKTMDTLFYFGLIAFGSFLFPQRVYPIFHIIGISFVINHIIVILLPWFAYLAYDWRPEFRGLIRSSAWFLIYFASVYVLNPFVDGNYLCLQSHPFFQNLPNGIYIPLLLVVILGCFAAAYFLVRQIAGKSWGREKRS